MYCLGNKYITAWHLILALACVCCFSLLTEQLTGQSLRSENGQIHLSEDALTQSPQSLDGTWIVYWDTLLAPNDFLDNQLPLADTVPSHLSVDYSIA